MISEITQWIMELMRAHGQLAVFIGVMIEQIIVPIPSPLIIMGAGAILIHPEASIADALLQIAQEAKSNPEILHSAPHVTPVSRLDEVQAARQPVLQCLKG